MKTVQRNNFVMRALWQGALIILIAAAVSFSVNHFRKGGLPLVGDRVPPISKAGSSGLKTAGSYGDMIISLEEARALFLTNGAVFIDARPEEIYRSGHIKGALNLPPDRMDELLPVVAAQIPPDSLIVTYCDGESCTLSEEAALQLSAKGFSHVQVLVNGWSVWQDARLPTEK
jgi:rhodanese-related sulfurtransferase